MDWLSGWWRDEVVDGYKGPLLLGLVAFVVTFVVTRSITRMIRAGKGPFHNVSSGGVHMHHSTPGVLLLILGGFTAVGSPPLSAWTYLAGAIVGIGASLVLDEFAMIFRLQDVYWSQEGQLSVNMVTLVAACVGLATAGISPVGAKGLDGGATVIRGGLTAFLLVHFVFVAVTALKGKYPTALIALFISPVSWVAAVRLARPTSPWARRRYSAKKLAHAQRRAAEFDRRWGSVRRRWDDAIAGTPTAPDSAPKDEAGPAKPTDGAA